MDYGQYTSASLSRHEDDYDLSLREPQARDQDQDQRGEREQYLQDQGCPQGQEQVLPTHQDQPQVQHQHQQFASELQQLPQLDQSQIQQLHLRQHQRQLEYFAQLTGSPQVQVHQTLPIRASSTSTPILGFVAPPTLPPPLSTGHSTSPGASSPWDSPTSVFGGLTDAQLAAAMSMIASAGVAGVYGHEYGVGREHAAQSRQHNSNNATAMLPPITTLEMVEGARSTSTPGSVCSNLPPTPASSAAMTASPVAVRSEFGISGPQVQIQDGAQEEDQEQEEGQVQYEPPRVIQLVERPQRKSRVAAQATRQQQQNAKAQASSKSATQAKVGVAHAHRQSQRQNAKQQQQEESEVQVQKKRKEQQKQVTSASESSAVNTLQIQQRQQQPPVKQAIKSSSNSNPSSSIPPVFAVTVPSPSQWYGIHALATASHQRVGPNISSSSSSPIALKNSNNANIDDMPNGVGKQSVKPTAREAGHPYPPWLRQRRTVSGPARFTLTSAGNGGNREDADVNIDGGEDGVDAPSPSRSLPTRSPISESPQPPSDGGPTRFFSAPPPHSRPQPTANHQPPIATRNTNNAGGPRYLVRTDLHYDIPSNTLTAMLEVPGVPGAGIRIALCNDARNGARMLVVRGRMRRVLFPSPGEKRGDEERDEEAGYVVKERKCGEFKRVLIVPQETKREDIKVSMADGILFLRYPAGEQSVNINGNGAGAGTLPTTTKFKSAAEVVSSNIPATAAHTSNTDPPPTPESRASSKPNSKNSDSVQTPAGSQSQSRSPSKASTSAPNATSQSTAGGGNTSTGTGGMQYNFRVQTTAPTTIPGSGT
ncbi:hypothetical protein ACEPAI_3065 [Sanghuangporus weigelae]